MSDHDLPPTGDTPPPADAPPSPQRPLLRRDTDKHLAGVAGGLADYLGVDPAVIRVAFVLLTVFGGMGIALYALGWVAMPSPSMPRSYLEQWFGDIRSPAALIAVAVGLVVLLGITGDGPGPNGLGWGLLLIFGGWLLFRADSRTATTETAPPPPSPAPFPQTTWYGAGGTGDVAVRHTPAWSPPAPRPRSLLGRLTVGLALAAVGVAALLDQLGAVALQPAQYVALALTVTGVGLLLGAWFGRAYGLIALGLLLIPVMLVLSLGPNLPVRGGLGDMAYAPTSVEGVRDTYELGAGQLRLDLSQVDFSGTVTQVAVSVGLGQTIITVPDDVTVAVEADMGAGDLVLFGSRWLERPYREPVVRVDEGQGGGRLELSIDNGFGQVTVQRAGEE